MTSEHDFLGAESLIHCTILLLSESLVSLQEATRHVGHTLLEGDIQCQCRALGSAGGAGGAGGVEGPGATEAGMAPVHHVRVI